MMLLNRTAKYVSCLAAIAALLVATALPAWAQKPKVPAIVLQVKSAGEVLDDVQYLANVVAGPVGAAQIQAMLQMVPLGGVDQDKPAGMFVQFGEFGELQMPVFYVPLSDENEFRQTLRTMFAREQELGNGIVLYQNEGQAIYYKPAKGYGFLAILPVSLENLPDVTAIPQPEHDIELVIDFSQIPPEILTAIDAQMQIALAQQQLQQGEGADAQAEQLAVQLVQQLFRLLFKETDRLLLAIDVDRGRGLARLVFRLRPKENSSWAEMAQAMAATRSQFGAMIEEGDLFAIAYASPISKETKQTLLQLFDMVEQSVAQSDDAAAQDAVAILLPAARKCIEAADRFDWVVRLVSLDGNPVLIGVAAVPNSKELEKAVLELARARATVAENIAEFRGGAVHQIDVPQMDFPVFIAAPEGEFWFAIGNQDDVNFVAQTLDIAPDPDIPPVYYAINIKAVLEVLKKHAPNPAEVDEVARVLGDRPGLVRVIGRSDGKEFETALEVDEGALRVLGAIVARAAAEMQEQAQEEQEQLVE